jgi:predicted amidohydrolase YtcJ
MPTRIADDVDLVGLKYFLDGALGSRGAHLLQPYSDAPDTRGIELMTSSDLVEHAHDAMEAGFAVATHAIGDAANRSALDAYHELRKRFPDALLRIEHAQIVDEKDRRRFGELGVVAAMQPTHCTSDATMAIARLGRDRAANAYSWHSLMRNGCTIIGGSDFPVETADPREGLRAFVDRVPVGSGDAWFADERIDRRAALDAYTRNAPRGIPGDAKRGRIERGFDADLVVIDGDPFDPSSSIVATIVNGEVRYERS